MAKRRNIREFAGARDFKEVQSARKSKSIENGGTIIIECSNCHKPLVEVMVIRPDARIKSDITVQCPFCGDKSFKKMVEGQMCLGYTGDLRIINTEINTDMVDDIIIQTIFVETTKI
jgi:hypothetical protein